MYTTGACMPVTCIGLKSLIKSSVMLSCFIVYRKWHALVYTVSGC